MRILDRRRQRRRHDSDFYGRHGAEHISPPFLSLPSLLPLPHSLSFSSLRSTLLTSSYLITCPTVRVSIAINSDFKNYKFHHIYLRFKSIQHSYKHDNICIFERNFHFKQYYYKNKYFIYSKIITKYYSFNPARIRNVEVRKLNVFLNCLSKLFLYIFLHQI